MAETDGWEDTFCKESAWHNDRHRRWKIYFAKNQCSIATETDGWEDIFCKESV